MRSVEEWEALLGGVRLEGEGRAFVAGEFVPALGGQTMRRTSPVDGRELPGVAQCRGEDVEAAVRSARAAFEDGRWSRSPLAHRKRVLLDLAAWLEEEAEVSAILDSASMGKPVGDCLRNDIPLAAGCYRWFAEAIDKLYDSCVPARAGALGTVTREPLGVVGAITPWNYPAENLAWKLAPALAAGNSVVLKPAEQVSLGALHLAALARRAGIPEGVLHVLPGVGEVAGRALASHPDVDAVSFTGSTAVGKRVMECAARSNLKRVALECGGKSAFVVLASSRRVPEAAAVLARAMFFNQGQTCTAPSRLIVEAAVHDEMLEHLVARAPDFRPGHPFSEASVVGAMVGVEAVEAAMAFVREALEAGAAVVAGGAPAGTVPGGAYMLPTILDGVRSSMRVAQEEVFGPVLSVLRAEDPEDAIRLANDTRYGLAAAVWTDDFDAAHHVAGALRAGTVHVNCYGEDDITAPFGGVGESGSGSKDKSLLAFDDYMERKTTWFKLRWPG